MATQPSTTFTFPVQCPNCADGIGTATDSIAAAHKGEGIHVTYCAPCAATMPAYITGAIMVRTWAEHNARGEQEAVKVNLHEMLQALNVQPAPEQWIGYKNGHVIAEYPHRWAAESALRARKADMIAPKAVTA